jgi:(1->4)-alpha-D-glucan 1-alpha-D-glucosylmutase
VRQEDAEVFRATHELVLRWIHEGLVQGLRIDHVDGLLDPTQYLERLHQATTKAPPGDADQPAPLYVEKILAPGERLLSSWPVAGTTGYDFLNLVEDVFFDPHGLESVERRYRRLVGRRADFLSVARDAKRRILRGQLAADVSRIAQQLDRLYRGVGRAAALDRSALARAIIEVIAHLDAYRVYYDGSTGTLTDPERRYVQEALDAARESNRAPHDSLGFLWEILLPQVGSDLERSPERIAFVQRLQQVAVPAAAKGVEDTAFYAYVPLVSRAEVGGDPHRPTHDAVLRLHEENATRASEWPGALLCVSTHDTKRSADVRARLDVLSELGDSWIKSVRRWRRWNRRWKGRVRGRYLPDANTEYLLYQTLVGIWPLEANDHASMRSTRVG